MMLRRFITSQSSSSSPFETYANMLQLMTRMESSSTSSSSHASLYSSLFTSATPPLQLSPSSSSSNSIVKNHQPSQSSSSFDTLWNHVKRCQTSPDIPPLSSDLNNRLLAIYAHHPTYVRDRVPRRSFIDLVKCANSHR